MYRWPFDIEKSRRPRRHATRQSSSLAAALPAQLAQLLQASLGQDLILPADARYEGERGVFNKAFDPFPAAIAICRSHQQVALCLSGAQQFATAFCIRGSGHSFAGYSSADNALVIDLRNLNGISIDAAGTATVDAGCRHDALNQALTAKKLQLPLGYDALTVGGFMQGGGFSLVSRTLGMNCDNVIEVRVMLADGRIVTANEGTNHDLWWAIRGGTGGNLGVLLSVTYQTSPLQDLVGRDLQWVLSDAAGRIVAAQAITAVQDILKTAPPELSLQVDIRYASGGSAGAARIPVMHVYANYFGSDSELSTLLAPLTGIHRKTKRLKEFKLSSSTVYAFERRSRFTSSELQTQDWRALLENFIADSNKTSSLTIDAMGGAINAYPLEKSAYLHRDCLFNVFVTGVWKKGDGNDQRAVETYLQSWSDLMAPFWNDRIFQNFPYPAPPDFHQNYWGDAFPALCAVKRKYDPDRAFVFAQAIDTGVSAPTAPHWPPKVVEWLGKPIVA